MSTFAVLGEITFEVLTSWEVFRSTTDYHYAEHKVVEARPRLQWMATELQKISLEMGFHVKFTNPATQMNRLRKAAEDHQARALVFGNGVHRGYFVIESIEETQHQMADDGSFIALSATVELQEWIGGKEFDPSVNPTHTAPAIVQQGSQTLPLMTHPLEFISGHPTPTLQPSNPQPFNPQDTSIGQHNLVTTDQIQRLSSPGPASGVTYSPATYSSPGVSAIVGGGVVGAAPGNINNVSTDTITRAG